MRKSATTQPRILHRSLLSSALVCALFAACGESEESGSTDSGGTDLEGPQVTLIDPESGDYAGDTLVTLTGSGFEEGVEIGTVVTFGAVQATDVTVIDDETITCSSPAGAIGDQVVVAVINSSGSGEACCFEYIDTSFDAPQIIGLEPDSGDPEGGTVVTITGSSFTEVVPFETTVTFGGLEALDVSVLDDSTITCSSPPGVLGDVVEVMVSNPRGDAVFDGFTYVDTSDDPVVSSVEPSVDLPAGGIAVTITGSLFTEVEAGETTVFFGENEAVDAVVVDDATITCSAPAGLDDTTVAITVSNPRGVGVLADAFSYLDPSDDPAITSIDPIEGPAEGGTVVTISGSQFTEAVAGETTVLFGETPAADVLILDDTTITCTSPAREEVSLVTITVSSPRGTAELADSYTFLEGAEATGADVDGDGLMDLVLGAPMDDSGGENAGSVHIFLSSGGLSSDEDLSASDADLIITGAASGDRFGESVATGDLNHDGNDDLIVAATHASGDGMVFVFNGPISAGSLTAAAADHVFSAAGTVAGESSVEDRFGSSLTVRDLDGDEIDDLVIGAPGADFAASGTTVYAAGLRSPMGLHVSSDGLLWVAQSGSGSADPADPEGSGLNDAGVSVVISAGVVEDVVAGLPSITDEGFPGGTSDLLFDSTGSLVVVQQSGASSLSNSVLEFDVSGWSSGSSAQGPDDVVTQWEIASFGESLGYLDNNAYGVAEGSDGHLYVVNAGANAIFKIERPSGVMSEFATFPQVSQPSPFGPPFTDSVPTRILAHPDGFYVVNLTGFPFNDGAASVFDVDYAGNVTEFFTGLSRATDVAVNPTDGSLYVAQFDGFDLAESPPWLFGTGSVVRVTSAGLETITQVMTPTGLAFGADGTMYISSMLTGLIYSYAAVTPSAIADVGTTYVFRGGADLGAYVHASGADIVLAGEATGDQFGTSSGVGDFNGDGHMDLFVGSPGASTFGPNHFWYGGAVFLWLGPVSDSGSYQAADASYYLLDNASAMGATLSVGDVNGDGLDDLVAGAPAGDSEVAIAAGLVFVFEGDQVVYSEYASAADVILHGMTANGGFGTGLLVADFNRDGMDDILTAAPSESYGAIRNGRSFLFNGGPALADTWAVAADVILTGRYRDYEHFGSCSGAVDRDGDGTFDLCVSAFGGDTGAVGAGSVHVFIGGGGLVDSDADMADLILEGEHELDRFGSALSTGD